MKISARNIVISALLTWAVGLFMAVSAHNAGAQSVINVSGTTWVGTDSEGRYYEYSFQPDGAMYYKSPTGFWKNGTWKQDGNSIYMETNNKYSEYQGTITGTHMEGRAWNVKPEQWTWVADLRNPPSPPSTTGSIPNVSGTTWVGTDSDGDYYEYTFRPDGALYYKSPSGFWTNGTWKQDGNSIYMETNKKYSEYQGTITGTHMEGRAWNVVNKHWTWVADLQNAPPSSSISGVPSVSGTTWSGADSLDNHYDYEFRPDGSLRYSYETGSFTDGTWRQDGDSIYMSMNNKYSERLGRITGTHMEGNAWNVVNKHWTWGADLRIPASASVPAYTGNVVSLDGTTWIVAETNGDNDIFNFLPGGTLSYSYQNGSYTNGTWKQDGDSVYIEMNHKYVEYHGKISGSHIDGTASNVKGHHWTWTADMRSSATAPTP